MSPAGDGLLPEQRRAATHPGSVAVVAGAGTGKTHMLAHRFLYHLESGLDPLQVVAVTFTERAAAELRARIRALVAGSTSARPGAAALEAAQISTLHALAARICRDHPGAAGVPADFSVLDDLEGQLWLAERLDDALAALPSEVFEALAYPDVRAALQALLAAPADARAAFERGPESWGETLAAARREALRALTSAAGWTDAQRLVRSSRGADDDKIELARGQAADGLARLERGEVEAGLAALQGVPLRGGRQAAWPGGELDAVKDALRLLRGATREALAEGLVTLASGVADERLAELLPHLQSAFQAVQQALAAEKRRRRVLDFADLEVHALRALEDAPVRAHYASRWKAVLVDEFQDTNPVQEQLLERMCGGMTVTVVGDEKQSIYGFRGADVAVFRRWRARIRSAPGGAEVALDRSFRAHGALTATLNHTFESVLGELHQPLAATRAEAPHPGPHVSLRLLRGGGSKAQRQVSEARIIGRTLKALLDAGTPVWDDARGQTRPLRPDDIAVLTRTWQPLAVYGEILPALGVPAVHSGGGNLLDTREAKDALAVLRFLADPGDDLALAALLRGPFMAVDDGTLYRFARALPQADDAARRSGRRKLPWWQALDGSDAPEPPLAAARDALRELLRTPDWDAVRRLQLADSLTGYTAVLAAMPGAPRRLADWSGFLELVRSLASGLGDAFSVTRRLRRLLRAGVEVPRPTLQAEGAVTLLTIHRSKGLEWPLVVVADLERGSRRDAPAMLFDRRLGVAMRPLDAGGEPLEPALYTLLRARQRRREEAEARRLLYVALTRARDRLLLTAAAERRGAVDVLRPALDGAGIAAEIADHDPADAAYPAPPAPEAGGTEAAPLRWGADERERLGGALTPKRPATEPASGPGRAAAWPAALALLAAVDDSWLATGEALRAAGLPAPDLELVGAELSTPDGSGGYSMALGWRRADRLVALADAATPHGAFGATVVRADPDAPQAAVAALLTALR